MSAERVVWAWVDAPAMLAAFAGGLIAIGAVLLFVALRSPPRPPQTVGLDESDREMQNADVTALASALVTLAGALILLVGSKVLAGVGGVLAGLLVYYLLLVRSTRRRWRYWRNQVAFERRANDGRVTMQTAARIGVIRTVDEGTWTLATPVALEGSGEEAERLVEKRSGLRWALLNPRGFDRTSWGITRRDQLRDFAAALRNFLSPRR
jgi:hypothetical protein